MLPFVFLFMLIFVLLFEEGCLAHSAAGAAGGRGGRQRRSHAIIVVGRVAPLSPLLGGRVAGEGAVG